MKRLATLVAVLVPTVALSHHIYLIGKNAWWDNPQIIGNWTQSGYHAWDSPDSKTIRSWQAATMWQYCQTPNQAQNNSYQQSAWQEFKLRWVPDDQSDLPGTTTYTLAVKIVRSIGADAGMSQAYPPPSTTTTSTSCWFGNRQQTFSQLMGHLSNPSGFVANNFPTDPAQYRETASDAYPIPVTFALQEDGSYEGIALVPITLSVLFTSARYPSSFLAVFSDWGGAIIRSTALTCAGVNIE